MNVTDAMLRRAEAFVAEQTDLGNLYLCHYGYLHFLEAVLSDEPEPPRLTECQRDALLYVAHGFGEFDNETYCLAVREVLAMFGETEPKSDAQVLYEAEDLYEKPWRSMSAGERSQYERMAAALRKRIEASK